MGSVISYVNCPHCGSEECYEDFYYKTGEFYMFCDKCGYNNSATIINRTKRLMDLTDEDWERTENKNPYAAFKIKNKNAPGYVVGSVNSKDQLNKLITEYSDLDELEYLKVSRFDGEKIIEEIVIDNGPLFDSAGFTNEDNEA